MLSPILVWIAKYMKLAKSSEVQCDRIWENKLSQSHNQKLYRFLSIIIYIFWVLVYIIMAGLTKLRYCRLINRYY